MIQIGNIKLPSFPLILAPMEDVSDPPFRSLCKKHGADLMFTEFISSEGLIRDAVKSKKKLDIFEYERPIGVQIFGSDIDSMKKAVEMCEIVKPDIIDINYGCPVKKVVCKGAGAGILKDIPKMLELTKEIVKSTNLPVTVKTRLGWDEDSKYIVEVAEKLQDIGIKAISIHGRTRAQMYKGDADWSLIADVKNNSRMYIPVFGNGDITSEEKALKYKNKYGVDGIMIGRAAIGNPWIFNRIKHYLSTQEKMLLPNLQEKIDIVKEHLDFSVKWKGEKLGILEMRRHYSNYFKGIPDFKQHRIKLVTLEYKEEIFQQLDIIKNTF
jgi:tRNA-dihydrouridine synthase B